MGSSVSDAVSTLSSLSSAAIDTSSLIYLSKISGLSLLAESCRLYSLQEVIDEYGSQIKGVEILACPLAELSTDQKLIWLCATRKLPLVSEDKKLLLKAQKNNIPYFNSLMMLNFLLLKKRIGLNKFSSLLQKLKTVARYGEEVWNFGNEVKGAVARLLRSSSNYSSGVIT